MKRISPVNSAKFDAWLGELEEQAGSILGLAKYIDGLSEILNVVLKTGKMPAPVKMSAKNFAARLIERVLGQILKCEDVSEKGLKIAYDFMACLVHYTRCGFIHAGLSGFFAVLEKIFHTEKSSLLEEHPELRQWLWECVGKDSDLIGCLVKALSRKVETIELLLTFTVTLIPAMKYLEKCNYGEISMAITERVVDLFEGNFRDTNSQAALKIFELILSNKVDKVVIAKWLDKVFKKALTLEVFEKVLMTLKCVELLLHGNYKEQTVSWIHENFGLFKKVQIHDEFIKYLSCVWQALAENDFLEEEDLRELWNLNSSQSRGLLKPFFSLVSSVAVTLNKEHLTFFVKLVTRPSTKTKEWVLMLYDVLLALEKRDFPRLVTALKKFIVDLSKSSSSVQETAKSVAKQARAVSISEKDFVDIVQGVIQNPKTIVTDSSFICDVLDRRTIDPQALADKFLTVTLDLAESGSVKSYDAVYHVLFKLIEKQNVTFTAVERKRVFRLSKLDTGAFELVRRLMAIDKFPTSEFVALSTRIRSNEITPVFSEMVNKLYNIDKLTELPFQHESLLWSLCRISKDFAPLLCSIYAKNDETLLPDRDMITRFLETWQDYFSKSEVKLFYLSLLDTFISEIEAPHYVNIKRHKVFDKEQLLLVNVSGGKQRYVDPNMTVVSFLQMVKGKAYSKYSMKVGKFYPKMMDTLEYVAVGSTVLKCELVERPNDPVRARSCFPSEVIGESKLMSLFYKELQAGQLEVMTLMDKLPTYPAILDIVKTIDKQKDLASVFPVKYKLVFLYNFEVLTGEFDPDEINVECLEYVVNSGLRSLDELLIMRIVSYVNKNWPLKIEPQALFDSILYFTKACLEKRTFRADVILNVLEFGTKITSPDLQLPDNIWRIAFGLLDHKDNKVRMAAVDFLKKLNVSETLYLDQMKISKGKLSSEFFLSLSDHVSRNNKDLGKYLVTLIEDQEGEINVGQIATLTKYVEKKFITHTQLEVIAESIRDRFFSVAEVTADTGVIEAIANLASHLSVPSLDDYLTSLVSKSSWREWRINGDSLKFGGWRAGLVNLGQTCFLNSILQQFFAVKELRSLIFEYSGDDAFMKQLQLLFARMQYSDLKAQSPEALAREWTDWEGNVLDVHTQQDATEFSLMLLDKLENGLGRDPVNRLFQGTLSCEIRTRDGKLVSEKEDIFSVLPLAVQGLSNMEESLKQMSEPDLISDYKVNDETVTVQSITSVKTLPPHLIIHLKRFEYDYQTWRRIKISTAFSFPMEMSLAGAKYVLRGIVLHRGSADFGHYFSYILEDQQWFCCNDSTVTKISKKSVMEGAKELGYILFYSSVNDDSISVTAPSALESKIEKETDILHRKKILFSSSFLNLMELWAKHGTSDQVSCTIDYMFNIMPFSFYATESKVLHANIAHSLQRFPDLAPRVLESISVNSLLGCPVKALRQATTALAWKAFSISRSESCFESLIEMLDDFMTFSGNFEEILWLMYKIITSDNSMKDYAIENEIPKKLTAIITTEWDKMVQKKKRTFTERELYERADFTHLFKILTILPPQPSLQKRLSNGVWIQYVLLSKTDTSALKTLVVDFGSAKELKAFAKQNKVIEEFKKLIAELDT